ncbi:hypothetical protein M433DRAFT_146354 [Acidomyces richmondensis BFW]|nr:MAG: hypothetical protein FE78DRAFT_75663 [Acidomyces sp. 'richmondensis']KYG42901.1 hypothetical protein M433DRAFT_146354 [Acidomyces richmondensis BFW]
MMKNGVSCFAAQCMSLIWHVPANFGQGPVSGRQRNELTLMLRLPRQARAFTPEGAMANTMERRFIFDRALPI